MNRLDISYPNKQERKKIVTDLNALFAVKHMLHVSPMRKDIAEAIGINVESLDKLTQRTVWGDAIEFWNAHGNENRLPQTEMDLTLTGDMRKTEKLWQDMFDTVPVRDLQKFEHKRLRDDNDYPEYIWDVDDLRLAKRFYRCFHKGVTIGFQVLVLLTFFKV